ncbi:glycosyltransferase [Opitutales bacterium]|nr:glycosyltransferase [Opitutales bacterium]
MSNFPKVSIFMPVFNQQDYIEESILSIVGQTFSNWELVISDDCSTDSTYEIALNYQSKYPNKIKVFRNNVNVGITKNCNIVLRECKGKYISFFAGDDLLHKDKIRKQYEVMESNKNIFLCYHDVEVFDSDTNEDLYVWNKDKKVINYSSVHNFAENLIRNGTYTLCAVSCFMRNRNNLSYDERLKTLSDTMFFIDSCMSEVESSYVFYINEVLASYRKHKKSITANYNVYRHEEFLLNAYIEEKYQDNALLSIIGRRSKLYSDYALLYMKKNKYKIARRILVSCFFSDFKLLHIRRFLGSYLKQLNIRKS